MGPVSCCSPCILIQDEIISINNESHVPKEGYLYIFLQFLHNSGVNLEIASLANFTENLDGAEQSLFMGHKFHCKQIEVERGGAKFHLKVTLRQRKYTLKMFATRWR